jgi:hypothetical protein
LSTEERLNSIHKKGFNLVSDRRETEYVKVKIGTKAYEDATIKFLNDETRFNKINFENKDFVI